MANKAKASEPDNTQQPTPEPTSEPKPVTTIIPRLGSAIAVTFYDGDHKVHTSVAHILSVGALDESGQPQIAVAFPDPLAAVDVLQTATWWRAYKRITSVKHYSHPDVIDGRESVAWGGAIDMSEEPIIPQPAGDAERPYLTRQDDPQLTRVSIGQAAAVQSGNAPLPTTQTPLLNEPAG